MDSQTNKIDELLSGMLDGVLSEADCVELDRKMAKDPSIETRLDELAAIRKSLMSGRSTKSLRLGFAGSVTAAAKIRATEMGSAAPAWLVNLETFEKYEKAAAPVSSSPGLSRIWIPAGVLSTAALILFFMCGWPKAERQGIVSFPGQEEVRPEPLAKNDPLQMPESGNELLTHSDMSAQKEVEKPDVVIPPSTNVAENKSANKVGEDQGKSDEIAHSVLPKTASVAKDPNEMVPSPSRLPTGSPAKSKNLFLMVVVDLSLDPQAIESRILERTLEKYGIVYTDDLVLDEEQVDTLSKSRWVGDREIFKPGLASVASPETSERMGVLFLRSTASKLGSAVQELVQNADDFPECTLNMMDGGEPATLLVRQLSEIQVAENRSGFAGRLHHPAARGNPSPFIASSSLSNPMNKSARKDFKSPLAYMLPDHEEMSNILILLRPAKK